MLRRKPRPLYVLDTVSHDLAQYKKHWLMVCRVGSYDLEMRDSDEREIILHTFKQIINGLHAHVQLIHRRQPVEFAQHILKVDDELQYVVNPNLRKYGESYINYLDEVSSDRVESVNYLILKTDRFCTYDAAQSFLGSLRDVIARTLKPLNMSVEQLVDDELDSFFQTPQYVKEHQDYTIYNKQYRRTYVVTNYPRSVHPNWLKPLVEFPFPLEITQHFHPYSRDMVIRSLEVSIGKIQSSIDMTERNGFGLASELKAKKLDAEDLLKRLSGGQDSMLNVSMYITLTADDLESLKTRGYAIENALRQCQLQFRKAVYQGNKALFSTLPLCDNRLAQTYTMDSRAVSTMLPWTTNDYNDKSGIFYGINEQTNSIITFDRFKEQNANQIILGTSGAGKSMTAKTVEISRQLVAGAQVIVLDWSGEYREICGAMGGIYITDDRKPNWNHHLIVFRTGDAVTDLRKVWEYVDSHPDRQRVLIVDEFHNILRKDPNLMLTVMQEIRKRYCAPTLITQNVQEFLRSPEGKMILDLCSIKILHRLGENDVKEAVELFGLSKQEKVYLRSCAAGHGLIYTATYKTKIKVSYSDAEERLLTTDPKGKVRAS